MEVQVRLAGTRRRAKDETRRARSVTPETKAETKICVTKSETQSKTQSETRLRAFLQSLETERRLSPHTRLNYGRDIAALLQLAGDTALEHIEAHAVRRAVAQLHARGLSGKTLARMLSAWRGFFTWLARHHRLGANPCAGIRAPKSARALPGALSPDVTAQLLDGVPEDGLEVRDKGMFELFYSSGLRLAELVSLDFSQAKYVIGEAEITVTGKGGKTRRVPVGRKATAALAAWIAVRAQLARADEPALFVGARGRRISPRVVQQRLKRWAAKRGVAGSVHPHVLRHSFASHVLQSSGDLRAVQELLGHASISTTQVYTHLDFQHLARVYDAAHPRAKRKTPAPAKKP